MERTVGGASNAITIVVWEGEQAREAGKDEVCVSMVDEDLAAYQTFCEDFGPTNMGRVYKFCMRISELASCSPGKTVVVLTPSDRKSRTNACFLVGAYMIIMSNDEIENVKCNLQPSLDDVLTFRDISPGRQNFHLKVEDCWEALRRGKELGWLDFGPDGFHCDEYDHYDNPVNGDLHAIVPDKIIAMKGPMDLPDGALWMDRPEGFRDFSPAYLASILNDFDVSVVVRLNQPAYDTRPMEEAGIAVFDLPFDDCSTPPDDVVAKFLLLVESAPGAVAVHCKAGLGRTGTLVALHLVKSHGFSARAAMAWTRLMRPGSVIGRQQDYILSMEAPLTRMRARPAAIRGGGEGAGGWSGLAGAQALCDRIRLAVNGGLSPAARRTVSSWASEAAAARSMELAPQLLAPSEAAAARSMELAPVAARAMAYSPASKSLSDVSADSAAAASAADDVDEAAESAMAAGVAKQLAEEVGTAAERRQARRMAEMRRFSCPDALNF